MAPEIQIDKNGSVANRTAPPVTTGRSILENPSTIPSQQDGLLNQRTVWLAIVSFCFVLLIIFSAKKGSERKKTIHGFIWKSLEQGHPEHAIHTHLVKKGVDHDNAHEHIREIRHKHNMLKMEEYVESCLEIGHDEKGILSILKEHGWHDDHIKSAIEKGKARLKEKHFPTLAHVEEYIVKRLHLGHLEDEIRKDLSRLGFSHEHITHHVSHAKVKHDEKRLGEFIVKKRSQGLGDEEIRAMLLEKGWDKGSVEGSLKKARHESELNAHLGN